ncbi:MAG: hypothetical protein AAF639_15255 [Chloroflexota bacterium]
MLNEMVLSSKPLRGRVTERTTAIAAKWIVLLMFADTTISVDDDAGAAKMVTQEVEDAVVAAVPLPCASHGDCATCP